MMLRRAISIAIAWVGERMEGKMRWPWRLAMLIDPRVDNDEQIQVIGEFGAAPAESLDWFAAKVHTEVKANPMDLLTTAWQAFLCAWAWLILMSVAPIEFVHGRNRGKASNQRTWGTSPLLVILVKHIWRMQLRRWCQKSLPATFPPYRARTTIARLP